MKVSLNNMQTPLSNLALTTIIIIYFFTTMTGIELFILIGGCYALYTVGMAIATQLDYMEIERERKRDSLRSGTD